MTPPKIAVIYYSTYGHVRKLVDAAVDGARAKGATVTLYQFPETLSEEILAKQHAAPKDKQAPVIKPDDLKAYDGFIFAFPTRYGRAISQVSAFFDATGSLWGSQALNGKMATIITSTATQHGGQETTVATTLPFLVHQGLIYVPIGYKCPLILKMEGISGGSPWGATTLAGGDGSRQPTEDELSIAKFHGEHFTEIMTKYVS